jgi:hypothetical protein
MQLSSIENRNSLKLMVMPFTVLNNQANLVSKVNVFNLSLTVLEEAQSKYTNECENLLKLVTWQVLKNKYFEYFSISFVSSIVVNVAICKNLSENF